MSDGYRRRPEGAAALAAQIQDLQRQIDELRRSAQIRNATISGGSGLTIQDGGLLRVIDPDGTVLLELGALVDQPPRGDGKPQVGWIIRRDSGELAGYCLTNVVGGVQSWVWTDRGGHGVMADDAFSGVGLAAPYIPMPFGRARYTDWPSSTSATFEDIWRGDVYRQHPQILATVGATSDLAGTTGEVRVMIDGVQVDNTLTVGFGIGFNPFLGYLPTLGGAPGVGGHLTTHTVTVQARRTAGAGGIRTQLTGLYGIKS